MAEALCQIAEPGQSRSKHACRTRAVGIDLGTTNSLVAIVDGGKPVCLTDELGDAIIPSVVHYAADGRVVVGAAARDVLAPAFPSDTIASVKRFMGRGPRDAEATRRLTPYRFAPAASEQEIVRFAVAGGRAVTPVEISAKILEALRARAEAALEGPVTGAVITVPAYFDEGQRQATRDAGRLAGLEVLRLLNEPTAAALAYGLDKGSQGLFAVYDLGGGTFDISILKLEDGVFEVKATGGDSALGGDDFDHAIADALIARLGLGTLDARGVRRVLDAARALKERLTDAPEAEVEVEIAEGRMVAARLAREKMEALVTPVLERCVQTVPRGATQTFTTFADNQTGFELKVVQGERELVDECRKLAEFKLTGIPPMPAGMARLAVTFTVDADGILRVSAREETTGKQARVEVKPSYGLTDEEVERMLLDSYAHADADVRARLLAEQRVEADRIAAAVRVALAASPELATEADRTAIDAAMVALAATREGTDHLAIRSAVENLDHASKDFAARRMNQAFEAGLRGKSVTDVEAEADKTAPRTELAARARDHAGHSR